jgi:hypothetical protein
MEALSPLEDGTTGDDFGHVRVYEWSDTTSSWEHRGFDIDGEAACDYSGTSVSLSSDGSIIAIGAIGNDGNADDTSYNSGHVRVYEWNDTTSSWEKKGTDIDGEAGSDWFGNKVSLSGDGSIVAIGTYRNDGDISNDDSYQSGHVRVYKYIH